MSQDEVNITYETLFELLRREKNREELQKLNASFFSDVAAYLKEKEIALEQQKAKQDLFATEEKERTERQIENIKKILKELYEKREKKIVEMAVDASRTSSVVIDKSVMLNEEKMFYESILCMLNNFREGILLNLQQAKLPEIKRTDAAEKDAEPEKKAETEIKKEESEAEEKLSIKPIKFIHAVPKFAGPDMEEYGPFEAGETAELPVEVADVLINKGRAEEKLL